MLSAIAPGDWYKFPFKYQITKYAELFNSNLPEPSSSVII